MAGSRSFSDFQKMSDRPVGPAPVVLLIGQNALKSSG